MVQGQGHKSQGQGHQGQRSRSPRSKVVVQGHSCLGSFVPHQLAGGVTRGRFH